MPCKQATSEGKRWSSWNQTNWTDIWLSDCRYNWTLKHREKLCKGLVISHDCSEDPWYKGLITRHKLPITINAPLKVPGMTKITCVLDIDQRSFIYLFFSLKIGILLYLNVVNYLEMITCTTVRLCSLPLRVFTWIVSSWRGHTVISWKYANGWST